MSDRDDYGERNSIKIMNESLIPTAEIDKIPNGSFIARLYLEKGRSDYSGECLVSKRAEGEWEVYAWLVKPKLKRYMRVALVKIKKTTGAEKLTGTFEARRLKAYQRLFRQEGIDIIPIRNFTKRYNGIDIDFVYVELSLKYF